MFRNDRYIIYFLSVYLIILCILLQFNTVFQYAFWMLMISPVLLYWVFYTFKYKSGVGKKQNRNITFMYGHEKNNSPGS